MKHVVSRATLALAALIFADASVQGRFLQSDPVGYDADLNLYTYVGNNPVNMTDPHGLTGVITVTNAIGVRIIIPVVVNGNASPSDVARVTSNISNKWTPLDATTSPRVWWSLQMITQHSKATAPAIR